MIFGALNEQSIAWKVAERAVEEGAEIVLTNTAVSIRMGTISKLAEKCNTIVVPADATSVGDLENLIDKTMEHFGGKFDFMLHSIGMSPNVRKGFQAQPSFPLNCSLNCFKRLNCTRILWWIF